MRYLPLLLVMLAVPLCALLGLAYPFAGGLLFGSTLLASLVGIHDLVQTNHAVLKNYPLVARFRFLFEGIRPEIRQYFLESDHDEVPFSREQRALVYRRSKGIEGLRPFGTLKNVQQVGHEWINHSMAPTHIDRADFRITIGGEQCSQPYDSSLLNISGMSFGALSPTAIEALNRGACEGSFAHTTGEGSISRYHAKHGGDLIWQIGSGYFGCRENDGTFSAEKFRTSAIKPNVRMIEVKLSQGAKPGHGGILPASKVTQDIADARGVAHSLVWTASVPPVIAPFARQWNS